MQRIKQYDDEIAYLIQIYPKNWLRSIKSKNLKGNSKDRSYLVNYILSLTEDMCDTDFEYSFKTRAYWVYHKIESWNDPRVVCLICNKPIKNWNVCNINTCYKKTCCDECDRISAQASNEQTLMNKHGVKTAFQIKYVKDELSLRQDEIQIKRDKTRKQNFPGKGWNIKKSLQTRCTKYGGPVNLSATYETKIRKYGDKNWNNPQQTSQTKRQNKTFNTSKPEEMTYQMLCEKFGENDIIRQHHSEKYPFNCDFYIKHLDMFLECNYSWVHGSHIFNKNDVNDLAIVNKWKQKNTAYYNNAIHTWTIRDIAKINTAKKNNVNLHIVWSIEEFKQLLEEL